VKVVFIPHNSALHTITLQFCKCNCLESFT